MENIYYAEVTVTYKIPLGVIMEFCDGTPIVQLEDELNEAFDPSLLDELNYEPESLKKCIAIYYSKPGE
jgi:hypothetical protein